MMKMRRRATTAVTVLSTPVMIPQLAVIRISVPVHGEPDVAETPILSIAFVDRNSARSFRVVSKDLHSPGWRSRRPTQSGDLHKFGSSSRRTSRARISSANSLWEHFMLNSSESVNRVVRQYSVPSRKLRVDFDNELVSDADRIGPGLGAPSADAGIAKNCFGANGGNRYPLGLPNPSKGGAFSTE